MSANSRRRSSRRPAKLPELNTGSILHQLQTELDRSRLLRPESEPEHVGTSDESAQGSGLNAVVPQRRLTRSSAKAGGFLIGMSDDSKCAFCCLPKDKCQCRRRRKRNSKAVVDSARAEGRVEEQESSSGVLPSGPSTSEKKEKDSDGEHDDEDKKAECAGKVEKQDKNEEDEDPEAVRAALEQLSKCVPGLDTEDLDDPYKILCGAIKKIRQLTKVLEGSDDASPTSPIYEFNFPFNS